MTLAEAMAFLRSHRWAVVSTVTAEGRPEAAIVGVAVTPEGELVFDTLGTSRKVANLAVNPEVALVIGGMDGTPRTVQLEGPADFPTGADLERLKRAYFLTFTDGPVREAWPDIRYVRVRPRWLRFADYAFQPPTIAEFTLGEAPGT